MLGGPVHDKRTFFKTPNTVFRRDRSEFSTFRLRAVYDNSPANPLNPFNPPQNVRFGEQTTNEMCFVFLGVSSPQPGRIKFGLARP